MKKLVGHRRAERTTVDNMTTDQVKDLATVLANPRYRMVASRTALFRQLGLIVPTEPPRPPLDTIPFRSPPGRAHALTDLGRLTLQRYGYGPTPIVEVAS